ncbi:RT0821/Lpp0805 family surface protein [Pseudorhodobacter sp. W20_MBD10_FR17]|uniref:RT0821/Lpp0805 family surface protein n=1 Tax=Pseudorhodobacter sp. W20_MBD10_FR17 TaxID=3240266 RepID=UPI003F953B14
MLNGCDSWARNASQEMKPMHHFSKTAAALLILLSTACVPGPYRPNEAAGGITGAVVGGVVGSQFGSGDGRLVTTGIGVLIGSLIGSEIGRSMDTSDRIRADMAIRQSYSTRVGDTVRWNNQTTGNSGTIVVLRDGRSTGGLYCREFQQRITIDGRTAIGTGIACRQPDGTWRILQ